MMKKLLHSIAALMIAATTISPAQAASITTPPSSQNVSLGQPVSLSVVATGTGTINYQWQKDGVAIPAATGSSYNITSAQPWHVGDYRVKVTDGGGTVTSNLAELSLIGINTGLWKGLMGYYPLNGNTQDWTAFGAHGSSANSSGGTDRFGKAGKAWNFGSNVNSQITVPSSAQHNFGAEMTASVWAKFNESWSYHTESLIWNRPYPQNYGFELGINQDDSMYGAGNYTLGSFGGYFSSGNLKSVTGPSVPFSNLSKWNLFTVTISSGFARLFVNGVFMSQTAVTGSLVNSPADLVIGGSSHPVSGAYNRDVDDVRLYNRGLDGTEVSALYAAENAANNWRQQYFGSTANTGNAADDADPDKDGLLNLLEFALNLNPNIYNSVPASAQLNGSNLEYTYTRGTAAFNGGQIFRVEWSDTLGTLSWSSGGVMEEVLSDNGTVQQMKATLPAGTNGRRFVRLRVE